MARTFYLDPALDFVDRTGADKVGAELTGPGGFQAAIRGTGNAPTLTADDTLVIKAGTMAIDRLVLLDCNGTDVSAWEVGDVVRNKDGAGDDWTGVVIQERDLIATGLAADDILLVQIDSPETHADINLADGIENTTKAESADPLASATINPVLFDAFTPTATLLASIIGCSADWTEKGASNGTIIDGSVGANTAVSLWDLGTGTVDYLHVWNITFQNTSGDVFAQTSGYSGYWWLIHCKFDAIAGNVPTTGDHAYATVDNCIFANISGYITPFYTACRIINSVIRDCSGTYSLSMGAGTVLINVRFDNNTQEMASGAYCTMWGCVVDGGSTTQDLVQVGFAGFVAMASRFVNAKATFYALDGDADGGPNCYEDYNVFFNPLAAGDLESITAGINSFSTADIQGLENDDGLDADFNVEDGKSHDSTKVILNWDGA